MQILLDTQSLIWSLEAESLISTNARNAIVTATKVFVSPVSFYEIAVKQAIGKNAGVSKPISQLVEVAIASGFIWLPLSADHIEAYTHLPFFEQHRDPFDRMILAIALADNLTVISTDRNFALYRNTINVLW